MVNSTHLGVYGVVIKDDKILLVKKEDVSPLTYDALKLKKLKR